MSKLQKTISELLAPIGLDIIQPFAVGEYNLMVSPKHQLDDLGDPSHLALLIGCTKAFWNHFKIEIRKDPSLIDLDNPFDEFVSSNIEKQLKNLETPYKIRYAHRPDPEHVSFQKMASVSGLAHLSETHLSVHPIYGPWFSLRAVVVLEELVNIKPIKIENPCLDCENNCLPAFKNALKSSEDKIPESKNIKDNWKDWLALRDACPIGRAYRYDEDQIYYHYTKDKSILLNAVE